LRQRQRGGEDKELRHQPARSADPPKDTRRVRHRDGSPGSLLIQRTTPRGHSRID
jgi:hypothetical protein